MKQSITKSASKFIIVGIVSTILNYLLFYLLHGGMMVNVLVASASGYVFGLAAGFMLNHFWTYSMEKFYWSKAWGYLLVYMSSLGVSTLFLWLSVDKAGFNPFFMNVIAIGITTTLNFIGLHFYTYKG